MLDDTWGPRDLPVLEAVVAGVDADPFAGVRLSQIAEASGLSEDDVIRSLKALEPNGLIRVSWMMPARAARVTAVSGEARQIVGAWPSAETAADRLLSLLEQQIAASEDATERSRLTALREGAASVGRDVLVALLNRMLLGA